MAFNRHKGLHIMSERTVFQSIPGQRVLTISPRASAYDAARAMTEANCGSVIVLDATGSMTGILTERDLMTKVVAAARDPAATIVGDIMTAHPRFVSPGTRVSDAVLIMKEGGFRHLPILSSTYQVVGVFSLRDASPAEISQAERQAEYRSLLSEAVAY
jgi:CBS domain-containing protein